MKESPINSPFTKLLQWHNAIEYFDYTLTVDWAIALIENGIATENIFILASFSKPVESYEIQPYVSAVLKDLNLDEKYGAFSTIAKAHFHLHFILNDQAIRKNLSELYQLCNQTDHEFGLTTFYLIYHAWWELEEAGYNYYYKGANLDNIENILKEQARIWIDKFVNKTEK